MGGKLDAKNHCDVTASRCAECGETRLTMTNTINNRTTTLLAARLSPESAARLFKPSLIVTPADQAAPPAPDAWATDTVNTMDAAVLPGMDPRPPPSRNPLRPR